MHRSCRLLLSLAVLCWLPIVGHAQQANAFVHPVMRVPKLAAPPTIDGTIDPAEWSRAAAFTGVTAEGSVGGHGSLVPEIQQVVWYLGYDSKYLYLAMRSPQPKGTYPVARVKENDLIVGHPAVLFEDHVEIQILTHGRRDQASTQGMGFYKIMANAKGAVMDEFLYNGTDGTEQLWSMGGPVKCRVTPECWELELAVEIGRLQIEQLDNRDLVIQLVRTDSCTGMYFAGWVGAPWMDWQRFAEVSFVPDTPAFRFLKLGELGAGELDAQIELVGGGQPAEATVEVRVESAAGGLIHGDTRQVALAAGAVERLAFRQSGLVIPKVAVQDRGRRHHFEIKATARIGDKTVVLYHNRSPFMQVDAEFREKFLDKWIAGRPQSGEWEYRVAYLPYSDRLEASVDLDFFGMPEAVLNAKAWRVSVTGKGATRLLGQADGKIEKLAGAPLLVKLPQFEPGEYTARFELLDAAGAVISAKDAAFVRKLYPWEHNQLGVSEEVIPPFKPLTVRGRSVEMWGRTYTVASGGLPGQIQIAPPTGTFGRQRNLFAGPVRVEAIRDGKPLAAGDGSAEIVKAAGHRVDVSGRQQVGPVDVAVTAFAEYDGWYEVACRVAGADGAAPPALDALDLVFDLDDQPELPVDTLYVQRLGDGRYGNEFNAIPRTPGVHFKSTDLLKVSGSQFDWKSFVPQTYVGSGDRGLWFFAWSAAGWELRDGQPMLQVERLANADVRLRVRLLAGPVTLERPRMLRFALQAAPVRPNHPRYRTFNEEGLDAHDTRGYRYYGLSVDDFVNTRPEDYEELRKFVLYGQRYQGQEQRTAKGNYGWWHGHYMDSLANGGALTMYGSGQLTGMGPEEFRTFGGEWLGRSNWKAGRSAASDLGRWNYQGTTRWTTDEQVSVTGVNWSQSMVDFFVWYHKPLLEKAGFNGTWWDNVSISRVREYNPELERVEEVWNLYSRRQLVKRLNTLGWQLMRPPRWAANMHVDLGFAQTFWMVENDWYADGKDMTSLDQWPIGQFRAMARTKSTMQVARPWLSGFGGTTPEQEARIRRSVWAMLMSHDIHPGLLSHYSTQTDALRGDRRTMSNLRGLVNLPDTNQCLFAGYWLTEAMVRPAGREVYASAYLNTNLRTAALLFFNGDKQEQSLAGTVLDLNAILPGPRGRPTVATRIFDLESGAPVQVTGEPGRAVFAEPIPVGGHSFRLIGIVAE